MPNPGAPSAGNPPWLEMLHGSLRAGGLPVRELSCGDGLLRIVFAEDGEGLHAVVRPRASGVRGWGKTEGYILGYDGRFDLDPIQRRWMERLHLELRELEATLPADLSDVGAIFAHDAPPEERFRRRYTFCDIDRATLLAPPREVVEVLLRTTATCNQRCPFCSAPPFDSPAAGLVRACIEEVAVVFPGCMLSITGGEPTLCSAFLEDLQRALGLDGIGHVQVQTNAIGFGRKLDPATLPPSPRLSFFVSLHALDAAVYDRCTGTDGQLPLALLGTERLIAAGHRVTINCVVSRLNLEHLEEYVRGIRCRLPVSDRVALHFSVLICPEYRPETAELIVSYAQLAPRIEAAAALATSLGLRVDPLRASTHAAMPPCVLGESHRSEPRRPGSPQDDDRPDADTSWVKGEACDRCVEESWCKGVPRPYASRFGLDELVPITRRAAHGR